MTARAERGPPAVDKARVRRAFHRGAPWYESHARVQRRASARLLEAVLPLPAPPRAVLDVGAGTGALLSRIASLFPDARVAGVDLADAMARAARAVVPAAHLCVGDAEALPFQAGAFDLVLSTSTLQWVGSLDLALAEARRVLAPGGTLAVALFAGDTLRELRAAWSEALPEGTRDDGHPFPSLAGLGAALERAGLAQRVLVSERVVELHTHPLALLRALKRMGAGGAPLRSAVLPFDGLGARPALERMARLYQARHGGPDGVPATWEIAYAVARAGPAAR